MQLIHFSQTYERVGSLDVSTIQIVEYLSFIKVRVAWFLKFSQMTIINNETEKCRAL